MTDAALVLVDAVLVAIDHGTARVGGRGCAQLGVTEEALVLVETVLLTIETGLVAELGMTLPAAVFVTGVLFAPQPARLAQRRVTDEAQFHRRLVCRAHTGGGGGLVRLAVARRFALCVVPGLAASGDHKRERDKDESSKHGLPPE